MAAMRSRSRADGALPQEFPDPMGPVSALPKAVGAAHGRDAGQ